jgi:hypothetical protein
MKYIESLEFKIKSNKEQFKSLALCNNRLENRLPPELLLYIAQFFDTFLDRTAELIKNSYNLTTSTDIYNTLWADINYIRMSPDILIIYNEWEYGHTLKEVELNHLISKNFKLLGWEESFAVAIWFCIYH